ncbi:putative capsid protein [McMurdo Ice Shelf pond-associated circular DNA virus-3]|uniref:Putative capsid protein n=1 Tax=McMurdo Ice Shelf pond-associated circular DNA virus-3 TaxID=1521387 RepID=A0A075M3P7_9VIRU|nr:putative capsid protein [McMurdo Ice Shelf pond-associated circular DNA virus-3]AIF71508.1 putative capsid protein [McMurdo Ice Shelf pond-associated circular DNA virus-3]
MPNRKVVKKSKRKRTFGQKGLRMLSQAAGAAVGYGTHNLAGIAGGAEVGGYLYDKMLGEAYDDLGRDAMVEDAVNDLNRAEAADRFDRKKDSSMGAYAGKFKKNRRLKKSSLKLKALSNGYHATSEHFGRIEDPNCVYIHHSTFDNIQSIRAISGAMLRKLFKQAGIPLTDKNEEIPASNWESSAGTKLQYVHLDQMSGAQTEIDYIVTNNQGLSQILANWPAMQNHILSYLNGIAVTVPWKLCLFIPDVGPVITTHRCLSQISLWSEHLTVFQSSEIKVQNRTKGDLSGVADPEAAAIERVDSQPLIARTYYLKSGDIRLRSNAGGLANSNNVFTAAAVTGLNLIRSAQLADISWQNRPVPQIFSTCSKSADTILQPGDIKKTFVAHKFSGLFLNVLIKMRAHQINAPGTFANGCQGRSELMCFEEKIRTAGTNKIVIQYEQHYQAGAFLKSGKKVPFISTLTVTEKNNV